MTPDAIKTLQDADQATPDTAFYLLLTETQLIELAHGYCSETIRGMARFALDENDADPGPRHAADQEKQARRKKRR